jgi:hypothetical protein
MREYSCASCNGTGIDIDKAMRDAEHARMTEDAAGGKTVAEYKLPHLKYGSDTGMLPDPFAILMSERALPAPSEDD